MSKRRESFKCPKCSRSLAASAFVNHLRTCYPEKVETIVSLRDKFGMYSYLKTDLSLVRNTHIRIFLGILKEEELIPRPLPKEYRSKTKKRLVSYKHSRETRKGLQNPTYHGDKARSLTKAEIDNLHTIWENEGTYKDLYKYLVSLNVRPTCALRKTAEGRNAKECLAKIFNLANRDTFIKICKERRTSKIIATKDDPEVRKRISEGVRRAKIEGRGTFPITQLQINLFRELERRQPGQWCMEVSRGWYNYYTPDLSMKNARVAIEIDGWWIHGPRIETDNDYIQKSKAKHHRLDQLKNKIAIHNNILLIRLWDFGEQLETKQLAEDILGIINGKRIENSRYEIIGGTTCL